MSYSLLQGKNRVQMLLIALLALLAVRALPAPHGAETTSPDAATDAQVNEAYGRLPLAFEANTGQHAAAVDFLAHGSGYALWLTPTEAVFALRTPEGAADQQQTATDHVIRMQLLGGNPNAVATGDDALPGVVNYFTGNDPAQWRTDVATFAKARYAAVYPGIDLVYYGNKQRLEYDFVVAPGADPSIIALGFGGVEGLSLAENGDLLLNLAGRELRWDAPVLYQTVAGQRMPVAGSYRLVAAGDDGALPSVGFTVGDYDPTLPLVIDPVLAYSTFLGGDLNDYGMAIAVDAAGNAYVTGYAYSTTFPLLNAYQPAFGGSQDVFVTKLNPAGNGLVYSTFLGGSAFDVGRGIAVDSAGNAYITGSTSSTNFPITLGGAFDTIHNGNEDVFVTKLDPTGAALVYSTYLGGDGNEEGHDIALDALNRAYVTGWTESNNFPTAAPIFLAPYDATYGGNTDAFVARLNATGVSLSYSTFLGGISLDRAYGIAVLANEAYVTGYTASSLFPTTAGVWDTALSGGNDIFVTRFNNQGTGLVASTFVGGDDAEVGEDIAIGAAGHVFVTGWTSSTDYPFTVGAYDTVYGGGVDAVVTKLNPTLTALTYSTFIGGDGYDAGRGIALNAAGGALITGDTGSANFPTVNPVQAAFGGGTYDAFVARVVPAGTSLNFSTYHGGAGYDLGYAIAVDGVGLPYVTGVAATGFPTTVGAFDTTPNGMSDAYVTKYGP